MTFSWAPESTVEGHLAKIKDRLNQGRDVVQRLYDSRNTSTPNVVSVPGITPDTFFKGAEPPRQDDLYVYLPILDQTL